MASFDGKILQLCDYYLTNKPNITYFKCVYKRNTNFRIETETKSKKRIYNNFELTNEIIFNATLYYIEVIGSNIKIKSGTDYINNFV